MKSVSDLLENFTHSLLSGYLNSWVSGEGLLGPRTRYPGAWFYGQSRGLGWGEGVCMPGGWTGRQKILGTRINKYPWAPWWFQAGAGRGPGRSSPPSKYARAHTHTHSQAFSHTHIHAHTHAHGHIHTPGWLRSAEPPPHSAPRSAPRTAPATRVPGRGPGGAGASVSLGRVLSSHRAGRSHWNPLPKPHPHFHP